jgi:hypothetical protein
MPGLVLVLLNTTPLAVTGDPPSEVILPPVIADVGVIDVTAVLVKVGQIAGKVVKDLTSP